MKKKGKPIQIQSPENYIRTKARSLAIFECLVNDDWKDNGIANVIVARKHSNGNITLAIYLVDLYCLGVKDTMYMFNIDENSYRERLHNFPGGSVLSEIDYTLAHNIVFAAIEYAGDYGFSPHKTFTSVTKYMLEEDTDEIELIDIECGLDGKPSFFEGPNDNSSTVSRILKQLERIAGKGNYDFTMINDDFQVRPEFDDEGDDFDDESDSRMSYDEAFNIFRAKIGDFETLKKEEIESFMEAVDVLFDSMIDDDKYAEYYDDFMEDLDIETLTEEVPDEILGLPEAEIADPDSLKIKLIPILELPEKKFKKGIKMIGELKKEYGEIPLLAFLELHFEDDRTSEAYNQKLKQLVEKFPRFPLIKIASLVQSYLYNKDQIPESEIVPLHELFPGRSFVHQIEMDHYLLYAIFIVLVGNNYSRLAAFHETLIDLEFPDYFMELAHGMIMVEKIRAVAELTNTAG